MATAGDYAIHLSIDWSLDLYETRFGFWLASDLKVVIEVAIEWSG